MTSEEVDGAVEAAEWSEARWSPLPVPFLIRESRHFRGCNRYHARSILRLRVDLCPPWEKGTAAAETDLAARFLDRFPPRPHSLRNHVIDSGFLARLRSEAGVPAEEALLQAILAVEAAALERMQYLEPVSFAAATRTEAEAVLVWETHAPEISRRAAALAVAGLGDLLVPTPGSGPRFGLGLDELLGRASRRRLSGSTSILKAAAWRRGLATGQGNGQHLHVGEGARQQYLFSSLTGSTSFGATKLALDKRSCNRRLAEVFLPVPLQIGVADPEAALSAARQVGYPLVIKPSKGNQGRGVTVGVAGPEDVAPAFAHALSAESGVVVEELVPGEDYRLLVVNGRMVAAATCLPPAVTGDGARTVQDLVVALNAEPDRDDFRLSPVQLDDTLTAHLARQRLTLDDVPEEGRSVQLLPSGHVATGGIPIDVTDRVHPDNRAAAEAAAAAVGLDVAGVDFVTPDLARSFREVGGAILEVNSRPGLSMHVWPRAGTSRDVAGPILDMLFGDAGGTVPKLLVAGDRGTGRIARAVDHLLRERGVAVGLCLKSAAYLDGQPYEVPDRHLRQVPVMLLRDPALECLVAATSLRRTALEGLGVEACDGAVILARAHDRDEEDFDRGLEVVVRANRGRFVVAVDDKATRGALAGIDPGRLVLVADGGDDRDVAAHLAAGGAAVVKRWIDGVPWMTFIDAGRAVASGLLPDRVRSSPGEARDQLCAFALANLAGHLPDATGRPAPPPGARAG